MNRALVRLAVLLCLVGAGSLCVYRLACDNRNKEEPSAHLLPEAVGQYFEEAASSSEKDSLAHTTHPRTLEKHAVVTELLAGRLTLLQAAARFKQVNADDPKIRGLLSKLYPDDSYEVALCRNVIEHARAE
jgi:hypothetical protein